MKPLRMLVLMIPVFLLPGPGPASGGAENPAAKDPQVGQSFRVPYRLTDTNHFLVRVRLNGKGPFNFLVDSGAPALYVATETAAKIGLKTPKGEFWAQLDRLDFEGGARLLNVKARVEDPFQLVGMNALGLPGSSIDGILGFTILARFRLEIDPTRDRMTWTRLAFEPPDPPVPRAADGGAGQPPVELQAMTILGPLAKGLAFLIGKQPEEERHPRGFLGLEWSAGDGADRAGGSGPRPRALRVRRVLEGSPAARAGLRPGDEILRIEGKPASDPAAARSALASIRPGDEVELVIRRPDKKDPAKPGRKRTINITAGEGL
jgi:hypothetical protein